MRRTALLFIVVIAGLLVFLDRNSSSRDSGDNSVYVPQASN
jgi:hypothetical protein